MLVGFPAFGDVVRVPNFHPEQDFRFEFAATSERGSGAQVPAAIFPVHKIRKSKAKRKRVVQTKSTGAESSSEGSRAPLENNIEELPSVDTCLDDSKQWACLPTDIIGSIAQNLKSDTRTLHSMRFINKQWSNGVDSTVTKLRPLSLSWGTDGMAKIIRKKFTSLKELKIEHGHGREAIFGGRMEKHLQGLVWLQVLKIQTPMPIDSGMKVVGTLTSLKSLDLGLCFQLSDEGVHHLANLKKLQSLHLELCPLVTIQGIEKATSALPMLTSLNLVGNRKIVTKEGVASISRLVGLKSLFLGRGKYQSLSDAVDIESVEQLVSLVRLETLGIYTANVVWEEIKELGTLPCLSKVDLMNVALRDRGGMTRSWDSLQKILPVEHVAT